MTFSRKLLRLWFTWRLAPAMALAVCGCIRDSGQIVIGLAGPMNDPLGVAELHAARLAVDQVNANGGIKGRMLHLRVADDSGTENGAVRAAQSLHDDPAVVAVVGHLTSGATMAAAPVYGGDGHPVPVVSPTASSPSLSGVNPYFFRVCPSDVSYGPALARFAFNRIGARIAGVIYLNDDYGRGVRLAFANEFTRLGGVVVEEDPFLPTTRSVEPFLSHMRGAGVGVLILAADVPGAEIVLRDMRSLGLRWPVLGSDAMVGIEADTALADGVRMATAYLPDSPGDRNAAFVLDYFRATKGERPNDVAGLTYDAVQLLLQAIEAVGADREAIRDYLATVGAQRPAFAGVTGPIAFDSSGDVSDKPVTMAVVRGGRLVAESAP
jgi:branched-chain amino acid transport system substrate-binding protein